MGQQDQLPRREVRESETQQELQIHGKLLRRIFLGTFSAVVHELGLIVLVSLLQTASDVVFFNVYHSCHGGGASF